MAFDANVLAQIKTLQDYQQLQAAFDAKRSEAAASQALAFGKLQQSANGTDLPAPLQLANEYTKRMKAGDIEGANTLAQFAKTNDRGIIMNADGTFGLATGYAPALGTLAGTKKGYETQAQKDVEVVMDPRIAGGEALARQGAELQYANPIAQAKEVGKLTGESIGNQNKQAVQAGNNLNLINEIETSGILDQATGSGVGAAIAGGKQFLGKSDESTQANAQLAIYGGRLLNNVPRMEGPQSDADRASYEQQAGKIADPRIPAQDKKAALQAIKSLSDKYAKIPGVNLSQPVTTGAPVAMPSATPNGSFRGFWQ